MSARLAILEREGIRFGLVSVRAYHTACRRLPCFTPREVTLLREQAEAMGTPLPLPVEMVRALVELKREFPEATIDDKIRDWPPSWQWLSAGSDQRSLAWDLDAADTADPAGITGSAGGRDT